MFIYTAKFSKQKAIIGVLILGFILMLIVLLRPTPDAYSVLLEQEEQAIMASITVSGVTTNEDRRIFLSDRGYDVSESEISAVEVQIPTEFDDIYLKYNELQKSQGFDLSKFKGKTVELYTYQIYNYDDTDEEIFANILIYKNKIIGGDIQSTALDGFITGFDKN